MVHTIGSWCTEILTPGLIGWDMEICACHIVIIPGCKLATQKGSIEHDFNFWLTFECAAVRCSMIIKGITTGKIELNTSME